MAARENATVGGQFVSALRRCIAFTNYDSGSAKGGIMFCWNASDMLVLVDQFFFNWNKLQLHVIFLFISRIALVTSF